MDISRRTLLKSGAGALAAAYSVGARPGWAARGRGPRIDEAAIRPGLCPRCQEHGHSGRIVAVASSGESSWWCLMAPGWASLGA